MEQLERVHLLVTKTDIDMIAVQIADSWFAYISMKSTIHQMNGFSHIFSVTQDHLYFSNASSIIVMSWQSCGNVNRHKKLMSISSATNNKNDSLSLRRPEDVSNVIMIRSEKYKLYKFFDDYCFWMMLLLLSGINLDMKKIDDV